MRPGLDDPPGRRATLSEVVSDPATRNLLTLMGILVTGAIAWTNINSEIAVLRTNQVRVMADIQRINIMLDADIKTMIDLRIDMQKILTDIRVFGGELRVHTQSRAPENPDADPAKK